MSLMIFFVIAVAVAQPQSDRFSLSLIHTCNWNGITVSVNSVGWECFPNNGSQFGCTGGLARAKAAADKIRKSSPNSVFIAHGNFFPGSPLYDTYLTAPYAELLQLLGVDAVGITHREFGGKEVWDDTIPFFNKSFDLIQSNVNVSALSHPPDVKQIKKHKVWYFPKTPGADCSVKGNCRAVGYFCVDSESFFESYKFSNATYEPEDVTIERELDILTNQYGANIIIMSTSFLGIQDRNRLLTLASHGVDIFLSVDEHSNAKPTYRPYPELLRSPGGNPVLVVGLPNFGTSLGFLNLTFDDLGVLTSWNGSDALNLNSNSVDLSVDGFIKEKYLPIEAQLSKPIGEFRGFFVGWLLNCMVGECPIGSILAEAMREAAGAQIGLANSGSLRGNITGGNVTLIQTNSLVPFPDFVETISIPGSVIRSALEAAVSYSGYEVYLPNATGLLNLPLRFPQIAGMKFWWNPNLTAGQRIIRIQVDENKNGVYVPLVDSQIYTLASNNYVKSGGDGYVAFVPYPAVETREKVNFVFAKYIQKNSPFIAPSGLTRIFPTNELPANPNATIYIYVSRSSGAAIAFQTLAAFGIFLALVFAILFIVYSSAPLIKASSPAFCVMILFGILMANVEIYFWAGEPDGGLCMARVWVGGLAFMFIFAPLLAKTVRIIRIMNALTEMRAVSITDMEVLLYTAPLLVCELILLIVWQSIAPLSSSEKRASNMAWNERKYVCANEDDGKVKGFVVVFFAYKAFLLVISCVCAYSSRNYPDQFSESGPVAFSLYNILIVGAVFLPILATLNLEPEAEYILTVVGIFVAANVTSCALFGYKLYRASTGQGQISSGATSATKTNSGTGSSKM